jgi:hypothetical protein
LGLRSLAENESLGFAIDSLGNFRRSGLAGYLLHAPAEVVDAQAQPVGDIMRGFQ